VSGWQTDEIVSGSLREKRLVGGKGGIPLFFFFVNRASNGNLELTCSWRNGFY
jgi:hypothetical protein